MSLDSISNKKHWSRRWYEFRLEELTSIITGIHKEGEKPSKFLQKIFNGTCLDEKTHMPSKPVYTIDDIAIVIFENCRENGATTDAFGIYRLRDGRFASIRLLQIISQPRIYDCQGVIVTYDEGDWGCLFNTTVRQNFDDLYEKDILSVHKIIFNSLFNG